METEAILELVKDNPSGAALYRQARNHGIKDMDEFIKGLEYQAYRLSRTARVEPAKVLGIPAFKLRGPDHINAGYLKRTAEELAAAAAKAARNRKLLAGTGLAALLTLGATAAFGDKPEDKYAKEVERLMKAHALLQKR